MSHRKPRVNRYNPIAVVKSKRKNKAPKEMDNILDINTDTDSDVLKSDSESSQKAVAQLANRQKHPLPDIQLAKDEMLSLLKEIRDSQSSLCTKDDLQEYGLSISKKFNDMDHRVSSNEASLQTVTSRISQIESSLARNNHDAELVKQNQIARNLSILGVPALPNEDLISIALKIFSLIGGEFTNSDIAECYRVQNRGSQTNIFIVILNSVATKFQILKLKSKKDLRLNDVISNNVTNDNPSIYVNNHTTPFFGKLLADGRKAVKNKQIHSVWLGKDGCRVRFEEKGKDQLYRNISELNALISHRNKSSKRPRSDDNHVSPNNVRKQKK